jgi:hypothetical protein
MRQTRAIRKCNSTQGAGIFRLRLGGAMLLVAAVVVLPGCGDEAQARLEDYLMELEFDTPLDSTSEIKLGDYIMSVAARQKQETARNQTKRQWVQLRFTMYAIVDPENESAVRSEIARHQGLLDDTILTVCRDASLDELTDNNWVIMKSRIIDRIRPILGQDRLRQLVVNNNIPDVL